MRDILLIVALMAHAMKNTTAQITRPVLAYTTPANVFRAGIDPPEDFSFNGFNACVQVYQFRPFNGDIRQAFETTLLRDWIAPMHQEENVGGPPTFQTLEMQGADLVLSATFAENIVGLPRPHMRIVIVTGNLAAIFDASAGTMQSWQAAIPALTAMADTMRIETAAAPQPPDSATGAAIAGLYQGFKQKYMTGLTGMSSYYTNALHFYLFSANGRACRAYDQLAVPGGNVAHFDFETAARNDPMNSGSYSVEGGALTIQMGSEAPIVTQVPQNGVVTINTVRYERK
jgi:hypothetical protein